MTAHFTPVSSVATVQVISQTQVADVERVGGYTVPSSIYLAINVPLKAWQGGNEAHYLDPPAEIVEGLIAEGLISGASFVEATDPSKLLVGFVDFTVSYTPSGGASLPFTTIVRIPMTALASKAAYAAYAAQPPHVKPIVTAYNRLVETAGGPDSDKV